jgi:hypothetical protein
MRSPDLDRERSEKKITIKDFLKSYNENLPDVFPSATLPLLNEFRGAYPELFKNGNEWSLDTHRKKVMDWLPRHLKVVAV